MNLLKMFKEKYKMFRLRRHLRRTIKHLIKKRILPENYLTELTQERFDKMIENMKWGND